MSVTVTFHGRAHRAKITETGGTADVLIYAWANNKAGTANVGYRLGRTKLGTYDFSWKVMLVDRKGRSLGAEVQTNDDKWFDGTTCPTAGTELAKYPITG